jgi:hypothetical protein
MRLDLVNFRGLPALATSSAASLLAEWRVGTILEAVATRDSSSGQLFLNMGGQRYAARLASGSSDETGPFEGERMTLRVLRNSPVLALERVATSAREGLDNEAIGDALRKFVPRQASPAPLVANLAWIARDSSVTERMPKAVAQLAERLWQALPTTRDMSDPFTLERALSRSGAFLEAALVKHDGTPAARSAVATDIKALMLQFVQGLREHGAQPNGAPFADSATHAPLPTANGPLGSLTSAPATLALLETPQQQMNELARQTEGALARLTTTQVANSAQEGSAPSLLIELPIRHEDRASMLRLRIEQERSNRPDGAGADSWTVEAALDLGAAGALHARITLQGFSIGVQLRAEASGIVEMLNARAPELEALLRDAGLQVERIVCRHGMPGGDSGSRLTRLLDVRA